MAEDTLSCNVIPADEDVSQSFELQTLLRNSNLTRSMFNRRPKSVKRVQDDGDTEKRRESLNRREEELALVTDEAVKQMEKMIGVTQTLHELQDDNNRLNGENAALLDKVHELENEVLEKEAENNELRELAQELSDQLTATRRNVALIRSETEKLKVERMVLGANSMSNLFIESEQDNEDDNSDVGYSDNMRKDNGSVWSEYDSSAVQTPMNLRAATLSSVPISLETIETPDLADARRMEKELKVLKRQMNNMAKQFRENEFALEELERENGSLRQRLSIKEAASRDSEVVDSRSKEELLRVIRRSIEDKVKWQSYAEVLIRRILIKAPNVLNIEGFLQDNFESSSSVEPRWETFALALVQKVMEKSPKLLDDITPPNRTDHEKLEGVRYV